MCVLQVVAYSNRLNPSVSPQTGQFEFCLWNLNPGWRGSLNPNLFLTSDHLNLYKCILVWKKALLNHFQTKLGNVWTALKLLTLNLIVVWWGVFFVCLGIFFIGGGWWGRYPDFSLQLWIFDLCFFAEWLLCLFLSYEVKCTIALFVHVPLCRHMNKAYIHICTGRLRVHKRLSANLSSPDISKSRPSGEICLLPGLHICLHAKKPECPFQNVWMRCKQVSKQVWHICKSMFSDQLRDVWQDLSLAE